MIFAVTYIGFFLITPVVFTTFNKRLNVSDTQKKIVYSVFVIALAAVAYCMKPPSTWDLSRNYILLDTIRNSGLSFYQFVFGGKATYIADGYRSLIFYNIYRYLFVNAFNNNAWFQTITAIIVYTIQFYIIYDYRRDRDKKDISITLTMLLSFAFLPFVYVTSGIRNALAASIMGITIYLHLYKKRIVWPILLAIIAITIHPSVLIVVPFVILSRMRMGVKGVIWVAVVSFVTQLLATLLSNSGVTFLRQIGKSYLLYSGSSQYRGGRGNLYGILIMTVVFILYFLWNRKSRFDENAEKDVNEFLMLLLVYMAGNFLNYDLVLRPGYIIGMFGPFLANKMQNLDQKRSVRIILNFIIILSCVYVNYKCFQILIDAF